MLFNSYVFIFAFLPITWLGYFLLNKINFNLSKYFLLFASLTFYSWFDIRYLPLLLGSLLFNYFFGNLLNKNSSKLYLWIGILGNVSLLAYFKYTDFFIENFNWAFNKDVELLHLVLPLAISYFTFQQIAYLIDNYKVDENNNKIPTYSFLDYSLFITFFPQLLMGPIMHHKELIPQFNKFNLNINWNNVALGLFIFSMGLAKKTLLGDPLTDYAQYGFDNYDKLSTIEAWYASISYVLSYYFDLSGYADMAIGLGKMFNINVPTNFNSPYKARNFADYWRRWHITLSRFLGDYIYKALGNNKEYNKKGGKWLLLVYINIMITFLVSGIWHGAGWTFVVWGLINGLFVIIANIMDKFKLELNLYLAWFLMFFGLIITRILFVSDSFSQAWFMTLNLFSLDNLRFYNLIYIDPFLQSFYLILGFYLVLGFKNSGEISQNFVPNLKYAFYTAILFASSLFTFFNAKPFLYFQF